MSVTRQGKEVGYSWNSLICAWRWIWPKWPKKAFRTPPIEEIKHLIKKPCAAVQEDNKRGVQIPGHKKMKAVIHRYTTMLRQNHTSGCLHCQHGTTKNLQIRWRLKGTGARPPDQCRQRTPELTPPLPGTSPAPTSITSGAAHSQIVNLPAGYPYSHTDFPCAEIFDHDASAQDSHHNIDFDPDMLTDEGTYTG